MAKRSSSLGETTLTPTSQEPPILGYQPPAWPANSNRRSVHNGRDQNQRFLDPSYGDKLRRLRGAHGSSRCVGGTLESRFGVGNEFSSCPLAVLWFQSQVEVGWVPMCGDWDWGASCRGTDNSLGCRTPDPGLYLYLYPYLHLVLGWLLEQGARRVEIRNRAHPQRWLEYLPVLHVYIPPNGVEQGAKHG